MAVRIGLILIDSCREQAYVTEHIGIVDRDEEAMKATHRQTRDGTMGFVLFHAIGLLNELHHIGEGSLERALHRLGEHHRGHLEALRGLTRTSLLRDVAVGHHHEHGLSLALGDEVVENLSGTA